MSGNTMTGGARDTGAAHGAGGAHAAPAGARPGIGGGAALDDQLRRNRRAAVTYLVAAAFCLLFSRIYAQYSHGVSSPYMTWFFLIPLLAGGMVFAIAAARRKALFGRVTFNAYNSGVATLTVASALAGVFAIAGTASGWLAAFVGVGAAFLGVAVVGAIVSGRRTRRAAAPTARPVTP
ncbi:MAG: hypothetical protein PHR15_07505 [Atopobiaceae bacterium]|jgi:general stress protein CsbA|nr:hypothetical protein [Atopobiaceae bacterium]MCH4213483.1 hypothetical protein [Atopobiaceae bacterium]MCI1226459.1 hypothetical protein [Atopobiaceae bacterium]MCI1260088.1 hypothetical protein [Atopobiaceae bacterium]MDD2587621.1 hypothetical protein [Atopobiaceae bacterium]